MNTLPIYHSWDLNKNYIQNARTNIVPVDPLDIVNKEYVDQQLSLIPGTNVLRETTHSIFYLMYGNENPINLFNTDNLFVNCSYTILIGVESHYNSRPASSVPQVTLFLDPTFPINGVDVTSSVSSKLILKSNQRIFSFAVNVTSLDITGNPILLNSQSTLKISETVNAVPGSMTPPFNTTTNIISDLSEHLINNVKICYLPLVTNSQPQLSSNDEILLSSLNPTQLNDLGINPNLIEINQYVKHVIPSSVNYYYLLLRGMETVVCRLTTDDNNISKETYFEPSMLNLKLDGTNLSETQVSINGITYNKIFIPLGFGWHKAYKNIMFYQISL
jgi:hypothetical protein